MLVRFIQAAFAFMFLLLSSAAFAGGPFVVDMVDLTGQAMRWQNDTFEWYADPGRLSSQVDNATARQWITEQLNKWTSLTIPNADLQLVSTAAIKASYKGTVVEDIDETNFGSYTSTDPGPSVVIFDEDGDIIASRAGEQNRETIVGLTEILLDYTSGTSGLRIRKGYAAFNGYLLSAGVLSPDQDAANELFKATILHELGHLLNLDHSQVNFDIAQACVRGGDCLNGQYIPTMYPELLTNLQGILSRDDKITLSWIYPTDDFESDFCTITGEIFDADGQPLKGVNVLAHRVGEGERMTLRDARSFVSGVLYPGCYGDSRYHLRGIVPGAKYQVTYEPIGSQFTGASDLEPLDDPPRGFDGGTIASPSGATTVGCDEGGETIQMASVTIDVSNPCVGGEDDGDGEDEEAKAGCAMISGGGISGDLIFAAACLVLAIVICGVRRRLKEARVRSQ